MYEQNIDNELAELLRKYPAIWNKKCAAFKDSIKKENSIKELAAKLNTTVEIILARYKALREKYRKEKLKVEHATSSGLSQIDFEPWFLMSTLSFFDSVQTKRKTVASSYKRKYEQKEQMLSLEPSVSLVKTETEDIEIVEELLEPTEAEETTETQIHNMLTPLVIPIRTIELKRKRMPSGGEIDSMIDHLANTTPKAVQSASTFTLEPTNRYHMFGRFVGETLSGMVEDCADDAILEIQQTLHKFKKSSNNWKDLGF